MTSTETEIVTKALSEIIGRELDWRRQAGPREWVASVRDYSARARAVEDLRSAGHEARMGGHWNLWVRLSYELQEAVEALAAGGGS